VCGISPAEIVNTVRKRLRANNFVFFSPDFRVLPNHLFAFLSEMGTISSVSNQLELELVDENS